MTADFFLNMHDMTPPENVEMREKFRLRAEEARLHTQRKAREAQEFHHHSQQARLPTPASSCSSSPSSCSCRVRGLPRRRRRGRRARATTRQARIERLATWRCTRAFLRATPMLAWSWRSWRPRASSGHRGTHALAARPAQGLADRQEAVDRRGTSQAGQGGEGPRRE